MRRAGHSFRVVLSSVCLILCDLEMSTKGQTELNLSRSASEKQIHLHIVGSEPGYLRLTEYKKKDRLLSPSKCRYRYVNTTLVLTVKPTVLLYCRLPSIA